MSGECEAENGRNYVIAKLVDSSARRFFVLSYLSIVTSLVLHM